MKQIEMVVRLLNLRPALAAAAQEAVDNHDFERGGACDAVAQAMAEVLAEHGLDARGGGWEGDDHAWLVVEMPGDDYGVDIHHSHYEIGGGYSWEPIPDAEIMPDDVDIWPLVW